MKLLIFIAIVLATLACSFEVLGAHDLYKAEVAYGNQ